MKCSICTESTHLRDQCPLSEEGEGSPDVYWDSNMQCARHRGGNGYGKGDRFSLAAWQARAGGAAAAPPAAAAAAAAAPAAVVPPAPVLVQPPAWTAAANAGAAHMNGVQGGAGVP